MSARRWTEAEAREKNVLSAEGFNREYDSLKGIINGGLDRTSTVDNWVSRTHLKANALHKVVLNTNVEMKAAYQTSGNSGYYFDALQYDTYGGGWISNSSYALTGLKEGVLHVEFSCFLWMNKRGTVANPKNIQFRLTWNGVPVTFTGGMYTTFSDPYLTADFPIAGDGTLTLEWDYTPALNGTDSDVVAQVFWGGGQILAVARWR